MTARNARRTAAVLLAVLVLLTVSVLPAAAASVPARVTGVRVVSSGTHYLTFSWSRLSGSPTYYCYGSTDGKAWKYLGKTSGTLYTWSRFGGVALKSGHYYYFRVRAHNSVGYGPYSAALRARTR